MDDVEGREPDGGNERRGVGSCSVNCSICLDPVSPDSVDRSVAALRCRHQFHLDCIASAFNVKGLMRCPNYGQVEKGQCLYGNGCHGSDRYLTDYDERPFRASSSIISRVAHFRFCQLQLMWSTLTSVQHDLYHTMTILLSFPAPIISLSSPRTADDYTRGWVVNLV